MIYMKEGIMTTEAVQEEQVQDSRSMIQVHLVTVHIAYKDGREVIIPNVVSHTWIEVGWAAVYQDFNGSMGCVTLEDMMLKTLTPQEAIKEGQAKIIGAPVGGNSEKADGVGFKSNGR